MIEIIPVKSLNQIQEQREYYINQLPFSQELHVEENVWESQYYKIEIDSDWVGYICVNSEKILWEFYLVKSALGYSQEAFKFLIDMNYIAAAECKSYDYLLMSLCFDFHKKASCTAYLFRYDTEIKNSFTDNKNIKTRLATKEDHDSLLELDRHFFYNLKDHIHKEEVFIFHSDNELLGAGTCKRVWHSMNYYDIGMVVAKEHRNKGIGTFIISKLKEYCYNHNKIPICACEYSNYSSKKALEKAGFISKHRLIKFDF